MTVAKPLVGVQLLLSIEEFTLERNPISALSVEKPLVRAHNLPCTNELTQERSPMSVVSVGRPSARGQPSLSIRGSTWEKLHVCRQRGPGFAHGSSFRPCGQSHTGEKSSVCDGHGRAFSTAQTLFCTGWFTLVRYLLGVMNVRNLLVPPYNPLNIRKSMLGEAL